MSQLAWFIYRQLSHMKETWRLPAPTRANTYSTHVKAFRQVSSLAVFFTIKPKKSPYRLGLIKVAARACTDVPYASSGGTFAGTYVCCTRTLTLTQRWALDYLSDNLFPSPFVGRDRVSTTTTTPMRGPTRLSFCTMPSPTSQQTLGPPVSPLPARDPCCEHPKWGVHPRDGSSQGPHAKISPQWLPSKSWCLAMQTSEDTLDTAAQEWNWADTHTCSRRALLNCQIIKSRNSSKRCHSFITCWDTISKETFI